MSKTPMDQKDYLAATDTREDEAASLESLLTNAGKKIPARPAKTAASVIDNYDALTAHIAKLRAMVAMFIGHGAAATPTPIGSEPAHNPDAAILAARGAKNISELNALGPSPFSND